MVIFLSLLFVPASAAQWTVGVYMCADNGMNDQADIDIAEMEQVGSTGNVNVVVQVDRAARDPRPGCYRYFIRQGGADMLADLGKIDMADPATLTGFAEFLRSRFPATNYLLVLWDHGNGWYPGYGPRASAIFIDDSHAHMMGVAGGELAQATAGVKRALGKRVRVLAFDACLMGMIEVAAEVRDVCDYMLASEALVPTDGLPYDKFLGRLTSRPTGTPAELLPGICSDYVEEYPGQQVQLSALEMSSLAPALALMKATLRDSVNPASEGVRAARAAVWTMPGNSFHIDLRHFLELLRGNASDSLLASFSSAVVANERSAGFDNASGLAIWFPDNYLALKASVESYMTLDFARESGWPQFLNRYFGSDDLKPAQPAIARHRQGSRGDVRLWWNSCFDLAPVRYNLYEATRPEEVFGDNSDGFSNWINHGWTTSTQQAHSGQTSFFSGSASSLANSIESVDPLKLPGGGLLSFYAWYKTKEDPDSAGISRNVCYVEWSPDQSMWHALDSFYGDNRSWHERRYALHPAENSYLRFRYVTGSSASDPGVFIDDIKVYSVDTMRTVASATPDTSAAVFGVPRDTAGYSYLVTATDSFGNVSMASQFCKVAVKTWAEPYTRPAPFGESPCKLVLDFPAGETPDVLIYTLSGALVCRFENVREHVLDWDGCNASSGKPLADGLYLVVVQGRDFRKLGKIAKVARPTGSTR